MLMLMLETAGRGTRVAATLTLRNRVSMNRARPAEQPRIAPAHWLVKLRGGAGWARLDRSFPLTEWDESSAIEPTFAEKFPAFPHWGQQTSFPPTQPSSPPTHFPICHHGYPTLPPLSSFRAAPAAVAAAGVQLPGRHGPPRAHLAFLSPPPNQQHISSNARRSPRPRRRKASPSVARGCSLG